MTAAEALRPDPGQAEEPLLYFRDEVFLPLPSGALYWLAEATLLVADLHLEKMSSFARGGQLLPPYDTGMTLLRLQADIAGTGARRVIALGDSFHRAEGPETLLPADRALLGGLMAMADWLWLAGNHDPAPHGLGGRSAGRHACRGLVLAHEPNAHDVGLLAGHLHPAARVAINGRSTRRACFVADGRLMILPAYGSATGSLNVLDRAFSGLFRLPDLQVMMIGRDRVYPVSPKRLIPG